MTSSSFSEILTKDTPSWVSFVSISEKTPHYGVSFVSISEKTPHYGVSFVSISEKTPHYGVSFVSISEKTPHNGMSFVSISEKTPHYGVSFVSISEKDSIVHMCDPWWHLWACSVIYIRQLSLSHVMWYLVINIFHCVLVMHRLTNWPLGDGPVTHWTLGDACASNLMSLIFKLISSISC